MPVTGCSNEQELVWGYKNQSERRKGLWGACQVGNMCTRYTMS